MPQVNLNPLEPFKLMKSPIHPNSINQCNFNNVYKKLLNQRKQKNMFRTIKTTIVHSQTLGKSTELASPNGS